MIKLSDDKHFWITNRTNRSIGITDLGIYIGPHRSINLLDHKHYSFTLEELELSEKSGSLYGKKSFVSHRKFPPPMLKTNSQDLNYNTVIESRRQNAVQVEEVYYEELDFSIDEFAEEAANMVDKK